MNLCLSRGAARCLPALALAGLLLGGVGAPAAPGAHGPNGEHLDGPATAMTGAALPRLEAKSEAFELVATLQAGELSVFIDRFATNEPVLNAVLEVESGGLRSQARFHADHGDYAVDDAKLLALLRTPGEHALVFTLAAGQDNDLLDGTLVTAAGDIPAAAAHDHAGERRAWVAAGIAALGLIGGTAWWRQRRRQASQAQGSLS
ncbi:MAG: hypothetical protein KBC73_13765 [Burkholderiaceae bacterium]|nr:hypothetical protein [Burkholderiaceae bacterium]